MATDTTAPGITSAHPRPQFFLIGPPNSLPGESWRIASAMDLPISVVFSPSIFRIFVEENAGLVQFHSLISFFFSLDH